MSKQLDSALQRRAILGRVLKNFGYLKLAFFLGRILYHLQIDGEENLPSSGACIFSINHCAFISDALAFVTVFRARPDVYTMSMEFPGGYNPMEQFLLDMWEFDTASRMIRAFKAFGVAGGELFKARKLLLQGKCILIAPEGDISWDGRFQYPLEPGIAWLALRTAVPVVPVISTGGYTVQPRWDRKIYLTGRIKIRVGRPFRICNTPISELSDQALEDARQLIWDKMNDLINTH